jgi:hypothetical protein
MKINKVQNAPGHTEAPNAENGAGPAAHDNSKHFQVKPDNKTEAGSDSPGNSVVSQTSKEVKIMQKYSEYESLTDEEKQAVDLMLHEFKKLFAIKEDGIPHTFVGHCEIMAQGARDTFMWLREEDLCDGENSHAL